MRARLGPARCAVLLLWCLGAAPAARCAEAPPQADSGSPFEARLELLGPDGRRSGAFAAGVAMELVFTVKNTADTRQILSLPSAQTHDFSVSSADGRELWRWAVGRSFAQMLTELELAPGEEKSFRVRWEPRDPQGGALPPGSYRASGWLAGRRAAAAASEFRIE